MTTTAYEELNSKGQMASDLVHILTMIRRIWIVLNFFLGLWFDI